MSDESIAAAEIKINQPADVTKDDIKSERENKISHCANCGKAGGNDIKLKKCSACRLLFYCGIECQKEHRPKHKRECQKRAAELRDELLFKQPESTHLGDCPICCLPMPLHQDESKLQQCCCKVICVGCSMAKAEKEYEEGHEFSRCAFCRKVPPYGLGEIRKSLMKRAEKNDMVALQQVGLMYHDDGDYVNAMKYNKKSAKLGNAIAYQNIGAMYSLGLGVEQNDKKMIHNFEEAAIRGHHHARFQLGIIEHALENYDRAMKHLIIASHLGYEGAIEALKQYRDEGKLSHEDYADTESKYQEAVEAMKSPQREKAAYVNACYDQDHFDPESYSFQS